MRTGGQARPRRRLVTELAEHAGAEVVDQDQPAPLREHRELREARLLREADDAEVRLVHAQQHRGLGGDRALVVRHARAVRRPHLDEPGAGAGEHVRDAEAVTDLDQLAARDDHLTPLGQGGEREQHRGRVVVDDEGRFRPRQVAHVPGHVGLPRAAGARLEIELEIRVAAGNLRDPLERGGGERSAAEVRVGDHAGGVDHAAQAGAEDRVRLRPRAVGEVSGLEAGPDLLAGLLEGASDRFDGDAAAVPLRDLEQARVREQPVDRRQLAQAGSGRAFRHFTDDRGRAAAI